MTPILFLWGALMGSPDAWAADPTHDPTETPGIDMVSEATMTPAPAEGRAPDHYFMLGGGVDALEPWSIRALVGARHVIATQWALGWTIASRGPGMTITLDGTRTVHDGARLQARAGVKAGGSWRLGNVLGEPFQQNIQQGYKRYQNHKTGDLLVGAVAGVQGPITGRASWGLDLTAMVAPLTFNPAYSFRVAPLTVTLDLTLVMDATRYHPAEHHLRHLAHQPAVLNTSLSKAKAMRNTGRALTITSAVLHAASAVYFWSSFDMYDTGADTWTALFVNWTTVPTTIVGATMWGVGNTRLRRLNRIAVAPTKDGAAVVVGGRF